MLAIEPLNTSYDEEEVIRAISHALNEFYMSLTKTLDDINIDKILKRKILTYIGRRASTMQLKLLTVFYPLMYLPVRRLYSATPFLSRLPSLFLADKKL